ncbi:MAG: pilus assembly protein CpaE [Anaerolineae bacterium]
METISLETARRLKAAGLVWQPAQGDRFALLQRDLDDKVFVINDMATIIELFQGVPAVTFHGTSEWALDYVYLGEAVWLPEEGQLRERLHALLAGQGEPVYDLVFMDGEYTCRFEYEGMALAFRASSAGEAYAAALLWLLEKAGGKAP